MTDSNTGTKVSGFRYATQADHIMEQLMFDTLPPAIRKALRESPMQWSVRPILEALHHPLAPVGVADILRNIEHSNVSWLVAAYSARGLKAETYFSPNGTCSVRLH